MRTSIARTSFFSLMVCVAALHPGDSLAADVGAKATAPSEQQINIKVLLSALTAFTERPIQDMANALAVAAETQEIQSLDWPRMKPLLTAVQDRFGPAAVWYARPDGSYFTVEKGLTDKNLKDRPYFPQVMGGATSIGELVVSRSTGGNTVIACVPIRKDGQVVGLLGASIYLEQLAEQVRNAAVLPEGVVFYALDPKGQIALHSQGRLIFHEATQLGGPSLSQAVNQMLAGREGMVTYEFEGQQQQAVYRTSGVTGWKFAIRYPAAK